MKNQKLDDNFVGLKNTYEDKKVNKLVYVIAFVFFLIISAFVSIETYHIARDTQDIQNDIEEIRAVLNEWELIE